MSDYIKKDDYAEPRCLLDMNRRGSREPAGRIDTRRVIEKLDGHLDTADYASAERHLAFWYGEAKALGDDRGRLTVLNEQIGLYRKTMQREKGSSALDEALALIEGGEFASSITAGTTLVNAATACKAFGEDERALGLYRRAKEIYEKLLPHDDSRLGGLYNNMALTLGALGEYDEAYRLFFSALGIMEKAENGQLECAVTYLNLADLASARFGPERSETQIGEYIEKAQELLDTPALPHDGYYAFVCEKCAGVFGYYGYFLAEEELTRRCAEIRADMAKK